MILLILFIPLYISFIILPGLIDEDGYAYAISGFGKNQIHYQLFLGLTLGIGPVYIFFKLEGDLKDRSKTLHRMPGKGPEALEAIKSVEDYNRRFMEK